MTDMVEVTGTAAEAGEVVTVEAVAATATGTAQGDLTVRTEGPMLETVVQIMAVRGTVAEAVTVTQGVTDTPAPEAARPGTRAAPETDPDLMTGPVVDPVGTMIVIENMACMKRSLFRCFDEGKMK